MQSEINKRVLDIPDDGLLQFWLHQGHKIFRIIEWGTDSLRCREELDKAVKLASADGKTPLIVWRAFDSGEVAHVLVD